MNIASVHWSSQSLADKGKKTETEWLIESNHRPDDFFFKGYVSLEHVYSIRRRILKGKG